MVLVIYLKAAMFTETGLTTTGKNGWMVIGKAHNAHTTLLAYGDGKRFECLVAHSVVGSTRERAIVVRRSGSRTKDYPLDVLQTGTGQELRGELDAAYDGCAWALWKHLGKGHTHSHAGDFQGEGAMWRRRA